MQELEGKYHALPDRDRLILNVVAFIVGIFLMYRLVFAPALGYLDNASHAYQQQLESYEWMVAKESEAKALLGSVKSEREGSLLSLASASAKTHSLNFSRFEPMGDDRVRLWIEQAKFNDVVNWLGELESDQGISAIDISLDSSAPGYVSVRLTLQG